MPPLRLHVATKCRPTAISAGTSLRKIDRDTLAEGAAKSSSRVRLIEKENNALEEALDQALRYTQAAPLTLREKIFGT